MGFQEEYQTMCYVSSEYIALFPVNPFRNFEELKIAIMDQIIVT